jgi:hypothetical protein
MTGHLALVATWSAPDLPAAWALLGNNYEHRVED